MVRSRWIKASGVAEDSGIIPSEGLAVSLLSFACFRLRRKPQVKFTPLSEGLKVIARVGFAATVSNEGSDKGHGVSVCRAKITIPLYIYPQSAVSLSFGCTAPDESDRFEPSPRDASEAELISGSSYGSQTRITTANGGE